MRLQRNTTPTYIMRMLLHGRVAQLVERLSYTQVVIGSSPVAPIYLRS